MSIFKIFSSKTKNSLIELEKIDINTISKKEFHSIYVKKRKPVLLKGAAKNWPLINSWNNDYIKNNMPNYICKIVTDSRPAYAKEQISLKNYFEKYSNVNTLTLDKFNSKKPALFFNDLKMPNILFNTNNILRFFFFHAQDNAGTLPHIHGNAFNVLQSGKKYWAFYDASPIFAPKGYKVLNESNRNYNIGTHAKDWFKKELPKLPNKLEKVYHCIQEPGDIVYIPSEFSHAVLNKSEVMGIVIETK